MNQKWFSLFALETAFVAEWERLALEREKLPPLVCGCVSVRFPNLNKEQFRFPNQTLASISFEVSSQGVYLFCAVGSIYQPLVSMTQQHADERRTFAVILLGY